MLPLVPTVLILLTTSSTWVITCKYLHIENETLIVGGENFNSNAELKEKNKSSNDFFSDEFEVQFNEQNLGLKLVNTSTI